MNAFLFVYPVFLVESCSFVIEFNSCFVLSQEKSTARINKNNPYEKLPNFNHCMMTRYSYNPTTVRIVTIIGLIFPYSIKKKKVLVITGLQFDCLLPSYVCLMS